MFPAVPKMYGLKVEHPSNRLKRATLFISLMITVPISPLKLGHTQDTQATPDKPKSDFERIGDSHVDNWKMDEARGVGRVDKCILRLMHHGGRDATEPGPLRLIRLRHRKLAQLAVIFETVAAALRVDIFSFLFLFSGRQSAFRRYLCFQARIFKFLPILSGRVL